MTERDVHTKTSRVLCTAGLVLALLAIGLVWLSITASLTHAQASTIHVDGVQGTDQPDCGSAPGVSACATIGYALDASSPGDLVSVAAPWTKWSHEVQRIEDLASAVRNAIRSALTPPTGPVFLSLPVDLQSELAEVSEEAHKQQSETAVRPPLEAIRTV